LLKQAALLALLAALMPAPVMAQFDEEDDEPIVEVEIYSTDASLGYVRVAISHDIQPKEAPEYITIRWVGDSARIPLQSSDGGLRFESGVLQLVSAELRGDSRFVDGRPVRPRLDAVYPGSARAAAELFAGPWLVAHTERNGNMAMGVGMVSADGESARLILDTSAGPKRFVSDDLLAVPDSVGGKHGLEIRFRPVGESAPEGPALALARTIYVPDNTTEVDIETSKESYVVQVSPWRGPAPEDIKVNLMVDTSREMHGGWSFEEANGRLSGGGQQTWNKGLEIERIVVLEDQRPQPHKGRSYESFANNENAIYEDYSPGEPIPGRDRLTDYPFAEGSQNDKVTRTIMIVGKGLPVRTSDARVIRSLMDGFSYELVALPGENDDLFRRGWNKVEAEREADLASGRATLQITMKQDDDGPATDAIIFRATFTDLVGAGVKTLSLNNAIGGWHLDFADSNAHLRFAKFREGIAEDDDEQDGESSADADNPLLVDTAEFPWRHGTTGRNGHYETIHTPYVGDDIFVVIEDQIPMRRDSVDIDIFLNKKHVGRIAA